MTFFSIFITEVSAERTAFLMFVVSFKSSKKKLAVLAAAGIVLVGALIWATIKTPDKDKQNFIICNILIQIFSFVALVAYCTIDHKLYNYQRMDNIYNQNIQETLNAIKTIQEIKQNPGAGY